MLVYKFLGHKMMNPVAYPPIKRGLVKEEVLFGDAQEECNGQAQQLMASSPTSNGTINQELEQSIEEQNALNLDEGQQVVVCYTSLFWQCIHEQLYVHDKLLTICFIIVS